MSKPFHPTHKVSPQVGEKGHQYEECEKCFACTCHWPITLEEPCPIEE